MSINKKIKSIQKPDLAFTESEHEEIVNYYLKNKEDLIMFIDVETSGLPVTKSFNDYYPFTDLKSYDSARMIKISWSLYDEAGNKIRLRDYLIKPEGFEISDGSSKINGIPQEVAMKNGTEIEKVSELLHNDIESVKLLVGHNMNFHKNIIYSELFRLKKIETINRIKKIKKLCTATNSKNLLKIKILINYHYIYKLPSLHELYEWCFKKPMKNRFRSEWNVENLAKIYFHLKFNGLIES